MSIQSIQGASGTDSAQQTKAGVQINRDDFLKLLIAQLQNQDPLSPMDNQEFAVQLATFNSLEQLIGLNEKLDTLAMHQGLTDQLNSTALIGKEIAASGNVFNLPANGDARLHYEVFGNAAEVTVKILNSGGATVRQIDIGNQKTGPQSVSWNGENSLGQRLPAGTYSFEVSALDAAGRPLSVTQQLRGVVTGVNLDAPEPTLEIGQLSVPLSAITAVR